MKAEHILAVDASTFNLYPALEASVYEPLDLFNRELVVIQRDRAEKDELFRHPIPYTVVKNKEGLILVYQRGKGAGEQRLAGKKSVGFGGHIDLCDIRYNDSIIDLKRTVDDSSFRELKEELGLYSKYLAVEQKGMILDNSNAVGRVHVGLLQVATYTGDWTTIISQEEELSIVGWFDPDMIDLDDLEPWSRAAVKFLSDGSAGANFVLKDDEASPKQEAELIARMPLVERNGSGSSFWSRLVAILR